MFGRRRKKRQDPATDPRETGIVDVPAEQATAPSKPDKSADVFRGQGPWDAAEAAPELRRVDFGSLRIPVTRDVQLQVNMSKKKDQVVGVTLASGKTMLQVIPLAAPKSAGLWDELRAEISDELTKAKAQVREFEATFGPELRAVVPVPGKTNEAGDPVGRPMRFFGIDGPRWLLRGIMRGEGALDPRAAVRIEEVFQSIIVVRGESPAPPRELLELTLPPETRDGVKRVRARSRRQSTSTESESTAAPSPETGADTSADAADAVTTSDENGENDQNTVEGSRQHS